LETVQDRDIVAMED